LPLILAHRRPKPALALGEAVPDLNHLSRELLQKTRELHSAHLAQSKDFYRLILSTLRAFYRLILLLCLEHLHNLQCLLNLQETKTDRWNWLDPSWGRTKFSSPSPLKSFKMRPVYNCHRNLRKPIFILVHILSPYSKGVIWTCILSHVYTL